MKQKITLAILFILILFQIQYGVIGNPSAWTPIDVSNKTVDVVGEKTGSLQGKSFAGWYTDTTVADPSTGTVITAWIRWDVDSSGTDQIYIAFYKFIDADGDGDSDSIQKIIKFVDDATNIKSLDSIIIGGEYVLITWTYYDSTEKNNVKGALYKIDGTFQWKGNIRSTTSYEEYSRSCYVSEYNGGKGGFLIIWYTDYDNSIDGKWLYYDSTNGWTLTDKFDIVDTNNLYYKKADQMLAIGGDSEALVVYRKWDGTEGYPDLYAALVDTSNNVQEVKLYDHDGSEETVGVKGAYRDGYFIVPLLSGSYVKYQVISESDGSIEATKTLTSNGEHPYVIALSDRFVIAYINKYIDSKGDPKIANIDPSTWYHYDEVIDTSTDYAKHPLISYSSSSSFLYIWTGGSSTSDYNIKYAILNLGTSPSSTPSVSSSGTLLSWSDNQVAHGLGAISSSKYIVAFTDTSDGEEDLLAYVSLPDTESVSTITLYELPEDSSSYKNKILNMINYATDKVYVAVAFFQEDNPGGSDTISKALVDAKNSGVDVKVIIDDDSGNDPVYNYLTSNGVDIIKATVSGYPEHIMHNKFMVVDGDEIVVSTVNFIPDDFDKNNNTAIYLYSKAVAYFYEEEFLQMWNDGNGLFGSDKTTDYSFITFITYSSRTILFEGYFSPQSYGERGRIPNTIYGFLSRVTSDIYFASYIFTTSGWVTPIYDAMVSANSDGKTVHGVFDELMNVDSKGRRLYWFIDNNVPVAIDNHEYKMHAKLFTIDDKIAILGSYNPTKTATTVHDENILVIRDSDTTNGFAKQIGDYINLMYSDTTNFVQSPYQYTPTHLVITKVMFYPDTSGNPDYEWVEIYNPTSSSIDLSNYVIGDAENLIEGDDEGMYKFPSGATIGAGGYIVIAYDAAEFEQQYGFKPTYEIAGTDPDVPDLTKYDTTKFTGDWNLDDSGDEVILAVDNNGFLQVIDACWYGDSQYMSTAVGQPDSGAPVDITGIDPGDGIVNKGLTGSTYYDAVKMSDKYEIQSNPVPVPELWIMTIIIVLTIILYLIYSTRKNFISKR